MIRFVKESDLGAWLDLAGEVESLFGDMTGSEDFLSAITQAVVDSSALVKVEGAEVKGIIAFDRGVNEIIWLAVGKKHRGHGHSHALIEEALKHLDSTSPVYVQTFASHVRQGIPARKLYEKYGFRDYKDGGKNPAAVDTTIMIKVWED